MHGQQSTKVGAAQCFVFLLLVGLFFAPPSVSAQSPELTPTRVVDADEQDLSWIGFIDDFPNGTIVISQPQDYKLVFFSTSGDRLVDFGRKGGGPTEFQAIGHNHGFIGDTLWVHDARLARVTLIDDTGAMIRTVPMPPSFFRGQGGDPISGLGLAWPYAIDSKGRVLFKASVAPVVQNLPGWEQHGDSLTGVFFWASLSGQFGGLMGSSSNATSLCGTEPSLQKNCPRSFFDIGGGGAKYAYGIPVIGRGTEAEVSITSISALGDTAFSREYPLTLVQIPSSVIDSTRRAIVSQAVSDRGASHWRNAKFQPFYRPLGWLIIGDDGTIWYSTYVSDSMSRWFVLEQNGDPIGSFLLPNSTGIRSATLRSFLARYEDETGLQHVMRYSIQWR